MFRFRFNLFWVMFYAILIVVGYFVVTGIVMKVEGFLDHPFSVLIDIINRMI